MHGDVERISAVGARNAMLELHGGGKLFLELLDIRPADKGRGADDVGNGGVNAVLDC